MNLSVKLDSCRFEFTRRSMLTSRVDAAGTTLAALPQRTLEMDHAVRPRGVTAADGIVGEKGVSDGESGHSLLRMMTGCYGFHLEQLGLRV